MIRKDGFLDTCAVAISAVCAIHCLALPVLLLVFPFLAGPRLSDAAFHQIIIWVIVPTSIGAVLAARRSHPDKQVLWLVGTGLLILLAGAFWVHDHFEPWVDKAFSVTGGLILAIGHLRNLRLCRHH